MIYTLSKGNNLAELFEKSLAAWSTTYWSLSIATQLSASCLLAWRIWVIQSRAHRARARMASGYMPIIWIVLESGALLSFATVILLAFYLKKTNAGGVVAGICGQLVVCAHPFCRKAILMPGFSVFGPNFDLAPRIIKQGVLTRSVRF